MSDFKLVMQYKDTTYEPKTKEEVMFGSNDGENVQVYSIEGKPQVELQYMKLGWDEDQGYGFVISAEDGYSAEFTDFEDAQDQFRVCVALAYDKFFYGGNN